MDTVTAPAGSQLARRPGTRALAAGLVAFAASLACLAGYLIVHRQAWSGQIDLHVYVSGGNIVRHVRPWYDPRLAAPLYQWKGYGGLALKFTYPPFAALIFAVLSLVPWAALTGLSAVADVALLAAALWWTFRGLGYQDRRARAGAALLAAAAVLWTEPVLRTVYLGQVNLALMALILWDLTQPDTRASRWWKGAGVGAAAAFKLIPLIFIPYLLLTRRFRQAAVAVAVFAAAWLAGFAVLPADSARWWFGGIFARAGRAGFVGWEGNQSLRALITRVAGGIAAGQTGWLVAAVLTAAVGLSCAAVLARAGHEVPAILVCALTGLLVSPVSWDHHWVWIAPAAAAAGAYAVRAMRACPGLAGWRAAARWPAAGFWALAAAITAVFGAWPGALWGEPTDLGTFSLGLIWAPPNTDPLRYFRYGDRPRFSEYHWHGLQLLTGNAYVGCGIALLALMTVVAVRCRAERRGTRGPGAPAPASSAQEPAGVSPRT